MKVSRGVLLCFCLLTLTGMRDPFRPPEDRCRIASSRSGDIRARCVKASDGQAFLKIVSKNGDEWKKGRRWKTVGRLSA